MNTMASILKKYQRMVSVVSLLLLGATYTSHSYAVPDATSDQKKASGEEQLTLPENSDTFEYQLEDRPDPFVPFLSEKIPNLDPDEIISNNENLTGMQLFEPGQLNLVALIRTGEQYIAMVEDFNGKGYVIEEGIKIGRRGIVRAIVPNKVIIEEQAATRSGKILTNKIVMVLKKEGEE